MDHSVVLPGAPSTTTPVERTRSRPWKAVLPLALLLLVSGAVQWWLVSSRRIPTNSDQAISALMATHILQGRGHPVFYFGSTYAGSVEPHYLTVVFAIFGATMTSYRVGMGALVLLTIVGVYTIARRAFGPGAALAAAGYLAVPPFFFLYKGLTSDGAYNALNLSIVAIVLLCLAIEQAWRDARSRGVFFLGLGVAIGLAWWIMPTSAPISAAALFWLYLKRRPRPSLRDTGLVIAGVLLGSAPWTVWNLRHGWASLAMPELGTVSTRWALHNVTEMGRHSLGTLAAAVPFRITSSWETFPGSRPILLAALVILLVPTLLRTLRGERVPRLLWLALAAQIAMAALSVRYVPHEPRILFPYYVLVPPLVGAGFAAITAGMRRRALAAVIAVAFVAFHARSLAVEHRHLRNTAGEATGPLAPLEQALSREGIDRLYADYWTAYRLSFETGERIIAAPIPGEEQVRYPRYQTEVAQGPDAIVVRPPRDRCLENYLREKALPYRLVSADPYSIFTRLPASVFRFIAAHRALPLPAEGYRAEWTLGPHPSSLRRGAIGTGTVSVRNASTCVWSHAIHVGYHWRPLQPGLPYVQEGGRLLPGWRVDPGQTVTLQVPLRPPPAPGRYRLEYDLVFEDVAWFASQGSPTASLPVLVQ